MRSKSFVLTSRDFLVFIILSYATTISIFVDVAAGNRNYLVLFAAMLGSLLFFVFDLTINRHTFWAFVMFSIMAMRGLILGGVGELGSLALTFVYSLGYFVIASLLERIQNKKMFIQDLMRWIIYAFAVLSVIQMVASFTGLPIPNVMLTKGLGSYNSLAIEPSWLGRIVGISMLCYIMLTRLPVPPDHPDDPHRRGLMVIISFFTTMLLSGSSLAAIAIIVVFLLSRSLVWLIFLLMFALLFWPMVLLIDYEPLERAALLLSNVGSLDVSVLARADHSGALRIIPSVIYLNDLAPSEWGFWFGYGSDGLTRFFLGRIPGLLDQTSAGFIPGFAVIYGVIMTGAFFWIFALRQANRTTAPLIVFWLIFMSTAAWNTQVFWYGLVVIQIAFTASRENPENVKLETS